MSASLFIDDRPTNVLHPPAPRWVLDGATNSTTERAAYDAAADALRRASSAHGDAIRTQRESGRRLADGDLGPLPSVSLEDWRTLVQNVADAMNAERAAESRANAAWKALRAALVADVTVPSLIEQARAERHAAMLAAWETLNAALKGVLDVTRVSGGMYVERRGRSTYALESSEMTSAVQNLGRLIKECHCP